MEESCNTTSANPHQTQASVQEVTFVACFILLVIIITFGSTSNIIGLIRIFLVPDTLKNFTTTVHLLFISTVVCLFMGSLDLTQLISNYFQLGLKSPCLLKMFLHLVFGGATTSTTIAIAWERLLKIKQKSTKGRFNKCALFSFLWVFVLPYAFYIFFIGVNSDVPSLLVQICQADIQEPENTEVFHSVFLPLLYLLTLATMVFIYTSACLTVKRNVQKKNRKALKKNRFAFLSGKTAPHSASSASVRNSPNYNGKKQDSKRKENFKEDKSSFFVKDNRTQENKSPTIDKLFRTDHLKSISSLASIKEHEITKEAEPSSPKSLGKGIVLNPLRHTRLSAGGGWKTVRDALASKNLKDNSPVLSRNIVKKLRPELFKTDSSFSLFSEAVLFERKDMSEVKQKKMLKRTRSQKWMLMNISCDLEKPPLASDSCQSTDDEMNSGTTPSPRKEFSKMSLATKRRLFRERESSYSINEDSVSELETCSEAIPNKNTTEDTQSSHEENLNTKTEKNEYDKVEHESINMILPPSISKLDEVPNRQQEQVVSCSTPTIRITRPSNDHLEDRYRARSPVPSTDTMSLAPSLFNRSASECGSYISSLTSNSASYSIWSHDLYTQVVKRSLLLIGVFAVCILPICVLHLFARVLSPTTLLNVYPFASCIEQLYHVALPFLYVFTNKSLKDHLYKWQP